MAKNPAETPMMKQFNDIKRMHPDAILLFRCGDFYETYADDAVRASEVLGITLTRRSSATPGSVAMAGFPYHALDNYLPKLVRAGLRVAICDQLEDPKLAKKLVKRGVTELVTPGVSYSDTTLNRKENTFLASVHLNKKQVGVAFLDISTGEFLVAEGTGDYADKLLASFSPKEVLFDRTKRQEFDALFGNKFFTYALDDWAFTPESAHERLLKQTERETPVSQKLLLPQTVAMAPLDARRVRTLLPVLSSMGFDVEDFGGDSFVIHAMPDIVAGASAKAILEETALALEETGPRKGRQHWREELVAAAASRGAVRTGKALDARELTELLRALAACRLPYASPAGRPTMIFTSLRELDRKFGK